MSTLLLGGALAAAVAAAVHGGVGHRWLSQQLEAAQLPPSALFGDADVGRRVLLVTWHAVTASFVVTSAALGLLAVQARAPRELLLLVCALHVAYLLVGLVVMLPRPRALLRPVPPVFALCMTTIALTTGLAAR